MKTIQLEFPEWYTKKFFLNLLGFIAAIGSTVAVLGISLFTYQGDLVTWRTSTYGGQAGNHVLTELAIILLMWFIILRQGKRGKEGGGYSPRNTKLEKLDRFVRKYKFFDATLSALFVCSIVQILWYLPYIGTYGWTNLIIPRWLPYPPYIGSLWAIVSPLGVIFYGIYHKGFSNDIAYYIIAFSTFYIGWYIIGFPITLRFEGATAYLMNDSVNALEILSWWWAVCWWLICVEVYPEIRSQSRLQSRLDRC